MSTRIVIENCQRAGFWKLANAAAAAWSSGKTVQFREYTYIMNRALFHEIEMENRNHDHNPH